MNNNKQKRVYYERIEKGICPRCGKFLLESNRKLCKVCRDKYSQWLKNRSPELKEKHREASKQWVKNNPEKNRKKQRRYFNKLKEDVFNHYGKVCNCCGETHIEFLTIDHIDGGGNEHRRKIFGKNVSGNRFYKWLRMNNFPKRFQVLCWNCNMAKAHHGICPHNSESI